MSWTLVSKKLKKFPFGKRSAEISIEAQANFKENRLLPNKCHNIKILNEIVLFLSVVTRGFGVLGINIKIRVTF